MENNLTINDQIRNILRTTNKIVFFGGAGTSTECGIPDFRSSKGLYSKVPEDTLSSNNLHEHPEQFFAFFRKQRLYPEAEPHKGHHILVKWENEGKLMGIITQNIDGMHQKAGNKKVVELHGSTSRYYCQHCGQKYSLNAFLAMETVPLCSCHGIIRPDVVLFGEMLNETSVNYAVKLMQEAEVLIIGGTSLVVYPAAGLIDYFKGKLVIMINQASTDRDENVDLLMRKNFSEAMTDLDSVMHPIIKI